MKNKDKKKIRTLIGVAEFLMNDSVDLSKSTQNIDETKSLSDELRFAKNQHENESESINHFTNINIIFASEEKDQKNEESSDANLLEKNDNHAPTNFLESTTNKKDSVTEEINSKLELNNQVDSKVLIGSQFLAKENEENILNKLSETVIDEQLQTQTISEKTNINTNLTIPIQSNVNYEIKRKTKNLHNKGKSKDKLICKTSKKILKESKKTQLSSKKVQHRKKINANKKNNETQNKATNFDSEKILDNKVQEGHKENDYKKLLATQLEPIQTIQRNFHPQVAKPISEILIKNSQKILEDDLMENKTTLKLSANAEIVENNQKMDSANLPKDDQTLIELQQYPKIDLLCHKNEESIHHHFKKSDLNLNYLEKQKLNLIKQKYQSTIQIRKMINLQNDLDNQNRHLAKKLLKNQKLKQKIVEIVFQDTNIDPTIDPKYRQIEKLSVYIDNLQTKISDIEFDVNLQNLNLDEGCEEIQELEYKIIIAQDLLLKLHNDK
ncbi:hypothetical protein [Mycoplasma amphoriforme]|uniref:Uncharacterized protein n=1 Tax=Mycoplasma amphoriforme A39 TaxID=572419 RepID=A0A292IHL9_9MOLU|nr:unnamed protein product [Mycoplasma amphoriforme A39]